MNPTVSDVAGEAGDRLKHATTSVPPEFSQTMQQFRAAYPGRGIGFYSDDDWNRLLQAYLAVEGESVLDVGVGNGAFLNILARSGRFRRIVGIDIRRHSMLMLPDGVEFRIMSILDLDFPPDTFDTVVCMEVLEHLEIDDLPTALAELRRVCRHRLITTVPLNEPYPLFLHDQPGGHRQRFDDAALDVIFPHATRAIVPRFRVPWSMIIEDQGARAQRRDDGAVSPDLGTEPESTGGDETMSDAPNDSSEPLDLVSDLYHGRLDWGRISVDSCRDRVHWIVESVVGPEVLDIGCSQGIVSLLAARAGHRVLGVDIAAPSIERAEHDLAAEPEEVRSRVQFRCGDASTLDLPAHAHDTVILGEILEHLADPSTLVRRAIDLVRPDGRIIITTPFGHFPHDGHETTFTLGSFVAMLDACGLKPLQIDVADRYIRCVAASAAAIAERPEWTAAAESSLDPRHLLEVADRGAVRSQVILHDILAGHRTRARLLAGEIKAIKSHADEVRRQLESERKARLAAVAQLESATRAANAELEAAKRAGALAESQRRQLEQSVDVWKRHSAMLESSTRFRVGDAIVRSARSPRELVRLPWRVLQIARGARRRFAGAAPAPSKIPGSAPGNAKVAKQNDALEALVAQFPVPYRRTADRRLALRAVSILDEFSHACFAPELELTPLTRRDWRRQIDESGPQFALLESSWNGNNGEWKFAMTNFNRSRPSALRDLMDHCRERGLKTVFWNKEDALNYDVFIAFARECDHVFTSDANCLERYRRDLGHDRVQALPFAAQPQIHNPVEAFRSRLARVCFSGAWYPRRHGSRVDDLRMILEVARECDLDIFDRFADHPEGEKYRFPEEFRPNVRGGLPYERMLAAYRAYRAFINVNSVADSPTMFSRRVFELLACGTPVVSTESVGIREMLPDLVDIVTTREEAAERIGALLRDDDHWRKRSHLGYREVMSRHTYRHRLVEMLRAIGVPGGLDEPPLVSVITVTNRPQQIDHVLSTFAAQTHPNRELVLVLNADTFDVGDVRRRAAQVPNVRVFETPSETRLGECLNLAVDSARGDFIAKMDDDDHYGANYIADALLPFSFSDAELVGKHCHHCYLAADDEMILRNPGHEHRFHRFVLGATLFGRAELFREFRFAARNTGEDTDFLQRCVEAGRPIYASDAYNYICVRHADASQHTYRPDPGLFRRNSIPVGRGLDLPRVMI